MPDSLLILEVLNPNSLFIAISALIVGGTTIVKTLNDRGKNKVEEIKQGNFNADKVEELVVRNKSNAEEISEIKQIVTKLQNKQEIDNEYLAKLLDKLEKDFNYYREFIINNLRK